MTLKAEIVKEYISKYPDCKNAQLARIIYKKNKKVWNNEETVRNAIRYHKGQHGDKHREAATDKTFYTEAGNPAHYDKLPEPLKSFKDWKEYQVEGKHILAMGDLHIPYYDKPAIIAMIESAKKRPIDTILIGGDFMDFYDVSFWCRDPNARKMLAEIRDGLKFLSFLRETFPKAGIVYKIGNHEERLKRYVRTKAPELIEGEQETGEFADIEIVSSFENIIKKGRLGVNVVDDKRIIKIGKYLHVVHGSEFGGMSVPVNPARTLYNKGKEIALCFHFHQTSHHNEVSMSGQNISCWSVGSLCDLHPEYAPINKWNHGFCAIERDGDMFEVENKRIINGKVY
jgi:hypothetical protein